MTATQGMSTRQAHDFLIVESCGVKGASGESMVYKSSKETGKDNHQQLQ